MARALPLGLELYHPAYSPVKPFCRSVIRGFFWGGRQGRALEAMSPLFSSPWWSFSHQGASVSDQLCPVSRSFYPFASSNTKSSPGASQPPSNGQFSHTTFSLQAGSVPEPDPQPLSAAPPIASPSPSLPPYVHGVPPAQDR